MLPTEQEQAPDCVTVPATTRRRRPGSGPASFADRCLLRRRRRLPPRAGSEVGDPGGEAAGKVVTVQGDGEGAKSRQGWASLVCPAASSFPWRWGVKRNGAS